MPHSYAESLILLLAGALSEYVAGRDYDYAYACGCQNLNQYGKVCGGFHRPENSHTPMRFATKKARKRRGFA